MAAIKTPHHGERIRTVARALGIPLRQLPKRLGVAERTLFNWLQGKGAPRADVLERFVKELGANPVYLLTGEGPPLLEQNVSPTPVDLGREVRFRKDYRSLVLCVETLGKYDPDTEAFCRGVLEARIKADQSFLTRLRSELSRLLPGPTCKRFANILGLKKVDVEELVPYGRALRNLIEDLHRPPTSYSFMWIAANCVYLLSVFSGTKRGKLSLNPNVFEHESIRAILPERIKISEPPKTPEEFALKLTPDNPEMKLPAYLEPERIKRLIFSDSPVCNVIVEAFNELWTLIISEEIPRICRTHETLYLRVCPYCEGIEDLSPWERRFEITGLEKLPPAYERALEIGIDPERCARVLVETFEKKPGTLSAVLLSLMILTRIYEGESGEYRRFFVVKPSSLYDRTLYVHNNFYVSLETFLARTVLNALRDGVKLDIQIYAEKHPGYKTLKRKLSYSKFLEKILETGKPGNTAKKISITDMGELISLVFFVVTDLLRENVRADLILENFNKYVWPYFRQAGKYYSKYLVHARENFSKTKGRAILHVAGSGFMLSLGKKEGEEYDFVGILEELLKLYHNTFHDVPFDSGVYQTDYAVWPSEQRIHFRGTKIALSKDRRKDLENALDLIREFRETAGFDLFIESEYRKIS